MQAISFMQLALDEARNESSRRHELAIKETRVNGLIDAVRYETRILEALITLEGIRETPGMGFAVRRFIPASDRGDGDPVDDEPSGGDVVAQPRTSDGETAGDSDVFLSALTQLHEGWLAAGRPMWNGFKVPAGVQPRIPDLQGADRDAPPAVGMP